MNLVRKLCEQAALRPHSVALVERRNGRDRALTYRELDLAVAATSWEFEAAGLRPGDCVLVLQPVGLALYTALLALFHHGVVAVFVDPGQGGDFVRKCCELVKPCAFFGSPKAHLMRLASPWLRRIPLAFHAQGWVPWSRKLTRRGPAMAGEPREMEAGSAALITFTSGSTGRPKGIVRTHAFLLAQHAALESSLDLQAGEAELSTLPIFVLANLASGLTSVLADCDWGRVGRADGARIARQMKDWKTTRVVGSPAFLHQLLKTDVSLPMLRKIFTGGAPVFPDLLKDLVRRFPDAEVQAVYGSSEAEPIARIKPCGMGAADLALMRAGRGLLVGQCVEGLQVAILNAKWGEALGELSAGAFAARQCGPEIIGEIVVSGGHVVGGYLHGEGDGEAKFRVAGKLWHRTGDTGFFDAAGRLWLTGRASAVLAEAEGRMIYPFQIETALSFFPQVKTSAAVRHDGEVVLVIDGDAGGKDAREVAERFGILRVVALRIPLDKRHHAKVNYPELRAKLQGIRRRGQ